MNSKKILIALIFISCTFFSMKSVKAYSDNQYIEFDYNGSFFNTYVTENVRSKINDISKILDSSSATNNLYYIFVLNHNKTDNNLSIALYLMENQYDYILSDFFRGSYSSGLFLNSNNSFKYQKLYLNELEQITEEYLTSIINGGEWKIKGAGNNRDLMLVQYDPFNNFKDSMLPLNAYEPVSGLHGMNYMYDSQFIYSTNAKLQMSAIDSNYYAPLKINNKLLKIGDNFIPYANKDDIPLNYKMSFNSGESAEDMKKVVVTFNQSENVITNGNIKFRLQFGSNDYKDTNIPIFSHYKIYGRKIMNQSEWEEVPEIITDVDDPTIIFEHKMVNIKSTYDYVPNKLADASIEMNFIIPSKICIYQEFMIEFYFDNTDNYFINLFDSLEVSTWSEVPSFLADHIFYYFPPNYRYAFISSDKKENEGTVYFPTNHYNNPAVRMRAYLYDYGTNFVTTKTFEAQTFDQDDYYSFFEFKFNYIDRNCLVLTRKRSHKYYSYYDSDFLNNYLKLFPDEEIITNSEMSYFYAPVGYSVSFGETDGKVDINTPDGWIDNNMGGIIDNNDYTELEGYDTLDNIFSSLTSFVNTIKNNVNIFSNILDFSFQQLNRTTQNFLIASFIVIIVAGILMWLK